MRSSDEIPSWRRCAQSSQRCSSGDAPGGPDRRPPRDRQVSGDRPLPRRSNRPDDLRATGEQWEAFVAYGVVDQLMRTAGVSRAKLLAGRVRSLPAEEPIGVGSQGP